MTRADELTGKFAMLRAKIAENFHPDHYEVVATDVVPDGSGGTIPTTETVETGRCRLDLTGRLGSEGPRGDVITATSMYTAELPYESAVTEEDTLVINGREFAVIDVKRGGEHELFTVCELEERS